MWIVINYKKKEIENLKKDIALKVGIDVKFYNPKVSYLKKINNRTKRKLRNRKKLKSVNVNRYRISVSKSLNNLSVQIIDDKQKKTLVSASSIEKEAKAKKVKKMEKSSLIGEILAKRAKEKNISEVYFDRGEYKYHGRVKTFAETLRKNGLKF